jgi:hypothetical protein
MAATRGRTPGGRRSTGMWGAVQSTRDRTGAILTPARALVAFVALVAVFIITVAAVFVVRTRDDLNTASAGLAESRQHLARLDTELLDAAVARSEAEAALEHAREVLRADTGARDQLRATSRTEYGLLIAALQTLFEHRAQLEGGAARAKLLDECLTSASQVLNEAAVGDLGHLAAALPRAERLCARAEA